MKPWMIGAIAAMSVACGKSETAASKAAGPSVREIGSVLLEDNDTLPLGNLLQPTRAPDGSFYISDEVQHHVRLYAPDGALVRYIGRKGSGPGELQGGGKVHFLPGDSLIAIADAGLQRMSLFRAADGAFVRSFPTPAQDFGGTWTYRGDTATMGVVIKEELAAEWVVTDSTMRLYAKAPSRFMENMFATLTHGRPEVIPFDTLLVGLLPTEPGLSLMNRAGEHTGFVRVPVARRRGPPDDLFALMKSEEGKMKQGGPPKGYVIRSAVLGLGTRPDGNLLLLHLDADIGPPDLQKLVVAAKAASIRVWASLVSPDLSRACVDAEVPVGTMDPPFVHLRGDTLDIVGRTEAGDSIETRVKSFVIGVEGCEWQPTGGILAPRP